LNIHFFGKLYALLTVDLFSAKYKARFFYLLDIFLQSSHLPSNLIASFVKRLARLALLTPQYDQCLIITFIHNLIARHPTVRIMIDRQQSSESISENTYLDKEPDPSKTNALESSLWEIESLTNHHHPNVATCAIALLSMPKMNPNGNNERDMHRLLEIDYEEMFDIDMMNRSGKRKNKNSECPINFDVTVGLFSS